MRKSGKKLVSFVLATAMTLTTFVANTSFVSAATSGTFDATTLVCGIADKEVLSASELSAPFGVDGEVTKRCSWADEEHTIPEAITSVEVKKANGSALTVTVDGPATITAKMASTSSSNTSAIGIADASGNVLVQDTVTGTANNAKEITANVTSAGTYRVMSPTDAANSRGARIYTVTVTANGSSSNTTTTETTTETTTVAPVQTTTEAPSQTTTEAPSQATTEAPAGNGYNVVAHSNDTDEVYNSALPKVVSETDTNNTKVFTGADGNVYAYTGEVTITLKFNADVVNGKGTLLTFQTAKADGGLADSNRIALRLTDNNGTAVLSKSDDAAAAAGTFVAGNNTVTVKYNPATKAGSLNFNGTETAFTDGDIDNICGVKFNKKTGRVITINEYSVAVNGSATVETTTESTTSATVETTTQATTAVPVDPTVDTIKGGQLGVIPEVKGIKDGMVVARNGDYVDVDFVMYNSSNIHTLTYFIEYDPSVLILEKFNTESATGLDMLSYELMAGFPALPYANATNLNAADGNINDKPAATNPDFSDLGADGTKTEAELGRIKDAQMAANGTTALGTIAAEKAVLVSGHFKVVGNVGDTAKVNFKFVSGATKELVDFTALGATTYFKLVDELPTTTTTEITTETTTKAPVTETTTKAPVTETTTKAPVTETTTEVTTADTTTTTTVADDETETTTKKRKSSGGGGGSSSSKASGVTSSNEAKPGTKVDKDKDNKDKDTTTTPSTPSTSTTATKVDYSSFTAPNGTVITPPALADAYGKVYAGSNIPSSVIATGTFADTSTRAWAEKSIEKLSALGIINGVGNGKYAPDNYCKRADFIVMLVKTLGIEGTATDNFDDVVPGKYYSNAVGLAKEVGIATGYGDGNFGPEKTITRQDMMVLVAKTMEFLGADITASTSVLDKFSDIDKMADYAKPYAAYLVSANMVSGTGTGIDPVALMTRAQLAVLVDNLYDAVVELAPAPTVEVEETTVAEEDTEATTESEEDTEATTESEEDTTEAVEETTENAEETTEEVMDEPEK